MKHLFLIFLKQFEVNEYKSLIQFLQLIIEKYNLNPSKLYGFLTNKSENEEDDDELNNSFNEDEYANTYRNRRTLLSSSRLAQIKNRKLKYKNSLSSSSSLNNEYNKQETNETQSISSFSCTDSNSSHSNHSKDRSDYLDENQCQQPQQQMQPLNGILETSDCYDENYETDSLITDSTNKDTNSLNTSNTSSALLTEMFANSHEMINSFAVREETNSIEDYESNNNEENDETFVEENNFDGEQYWDQYSNKEPCQPLMNYTLPKEEHLEPKTRIRKFSEATRHELEKAFLVKNFISGSERCELATRLNLTERQVQKWFVHRREKLRKLEKKAALNSTGHEFNETQYSASESFIQKALNDEMPSMNQTSFNETEEFNETDYNQDNYDQSQYLNNDSYNPSLNETENYYNETQYDYNSDENLNTSKPLMYDRNKPVKTSRRLFPPEVITHLESVFDTEKYLKENQVEEIARVTNLSEKQIRSWFKQRRYRYNQENKKNGNESNILFKKRDSLSQDVVNELEKAFVDNNYIYGENKKNLCRRLSLKPIQLERWFYYRRKKDTSAEDINNETNNDLISDIKDEEDPTFEN